MRPYVTPTPTPIWDRLLEITRGEALASFNARRDTGAEWDPVRTVTRKVRRRLTGARLMRLGAMPPDVFAQLLRDHGGDQVGQDPIAWFFREAIKALNERQCAALADYRRRVVRQRGLRTYYEIQLTRAIDAGYDSVWAWRQARGWKENRACQRSTTRYWRPTTEAIGRSI